jgi:hypothetical protein
MVDATRFRRDTGPLNISGERPQSHPARELYVPNAFGKKRLRHLDAAPIFGGATLFRQLLNFSRRKLPVRLFGADHKSPIQLPQRTQKTQESNECAFQNHGHDPASFRDSLCFLWLILNH